LKRRTLTQQFVVDVNERLCVSLLAVDARIRARGPVRGGSGVLYAGVDPPRAKETRMSWFLALQGPSQPSHQASVYELQDSTDVDKLAQELMSAVTLDRVVAVPAMLPQNARKKQKVSLYVRPAAWAMWTFYELSEDDKRALMQDNPLVQALQQQHMAQHMAQAQAGGPAVNPLFGQTPGR
jgi:hypothetical protein